MFSEKHSFVENISVRHISFLSLTLLHFRCKPVFNISIYIPITFKIILQLVSYAAVLQRISKYDAFHKPHCIVSLLEFLESIQVGITCRGKPEEDLLAAAVLSIVHWLLQCYLHTLSKVPQNNPLTPHPSELMDKPASILQQMLNSDFLRAMMYLAKYDDDGLLQQNRDIFEILKERS